MGKRSEMGALRGEIASAQGAGRLPRYGRAVRERAVRLLAELQRRGETTWTVSAELGLSWQTLRRWELAAAAGRESGAAFRPVAVTEEQPVAKPGFVLSGPGGVSVTGLTVTELAALLRSLAS